MSDPYDINKLIAESKGELPPGVGSNVPLLGQQVPVLTGLPVNGGLMTIDEIEKLTDRQFRELMMAAIISLSGAVYMPPKAEKLNEEAAEEPEQLDSDPED